jgi:poly(3-hydroxyalkanoate) synthetase
MAKRLSTSWDMVRHHSALREIIKLKMKSRGLGNKQLAEACEKLMGYRVDTANLHNYLSGKNVKEVSQWLIINGICKVLGIKVELKITDDE